MFRKAPRQKRLRREVRKNQILSVMYYWLGRDGLSMRQVAFWCQISPSTHFMNILKELQAEGMVKALELEYRPNVNKFVWRLSSSGEFIAKYHINPDWSVK